MASILGHNNLEFLLEEDGTLWDRETHTIEYDPDTWEPIRPFEMRPFKKSERPFKCDLCDRDFAEMGRLRRHYFKTHKKLYQETK